jgi:lipid-A-disaccharide synthase
MNDAGVRGGAPPRPLTIMLVAGEPSGDQLGAQLMAALKKLGGPNLRIVGVGGTAMTAQGLESLFPLDDTAVMGLREVVPLIPKILARVKQAVEFALATRPALVVLIDSPDFTHRIAQGIKRRDPSLRTANYVAPQVWASREYRAKKMARYMDAVLTLFPFETKFFAQHGLNAIFVGHPVIERKSRMVGGGEFRKRHGIAATAKLLAVLPGSRRNEIRFILPPFKETVRRLAAEIPGLVMVIPTVPHVAALVKQAATDWPTPVHVIENEDEKYSSFDAVDAALAASGTVTMELALARKPMVVGYKAGWLTYALAKPLMSVPHITLVNLILGREAIPEFLQARCTPELLAGALRPLLTDETARAKQIRDLDEALRDLGGGGKAPSKRAARAILSLAEGKP